MIKNVEAVEMVEIDDNNRTTLEHHKKKIGLNNKFNNTENYFQTMFLTSLQVFLQNKFNKEIESLIAYKKCSLLFDNIKYEFVNLFLFNEELIITNDYYEEINNKDDQVKITNILSLRKKLKNIYDTQMQTENRVILKCSSLEDFSSFQELTLQFEIIQDMFIVSHLIEKYQMLNWQLFFEKEILLDPKFYYQAHFFLQKVNKRSKVQSRLLVFSNKFISNVSFRTENESLITEEEKWALAIESVKSITINKKTKTSMSLSIDKKVNQQIVEANKMKLKNKKGRNFVFYTEKDLNKFVFAIRRLFYTLKKSYITVNTS